MARGWPPSRSICSARAPACFGGALSGKTIQWLMRVPLHRGVDRGCEGRFAGGFAGTFPSPAELGCRRGGGPMRRLVTGILVCVVLAAGGMVTGSLAASYGPQQTVVIAFDISSSVSLDPQLAYEVSSTIADQQMYSNLVTFRGSLTHPRPEVAQSWDVSQDARTYTFHLKHGIVFSSGNPLTADDVLYTFQRVVNLAKDTAPSPITQTGIDDQSAARSARAP